MPTITIDTFLACSLMVILVSSAMLSLPKVLQAHMDGLQGQKKIEYYQQFVKYILLNPGFPEDWGSIKDALPTVFGLAEGNPYSFYCLDIDKVSRLNEDNEYAVNYAQVFTLLGMKDATFKIQFKPLFDISVSLISSEQGEKEIYYTFNFFTNKDGLPIASELSCFVVVKDYSEKIGLITASDGRCTVTIGVPYASNDTVMLVSFARALANSEMVSYTIYSFAHNSLELPPNKTFTRLSPINYELVVRLKESDFDISNAWVFSFNYNFSLNKIEDDDSRIVYEIPRLRDTSPAILVVACSNASHYFFEWGSYPQLPLSLGYDLDASNRIQETFVFTYLIRINEALYQCVVTIGEVT